MNTKKISYVNQDVYIGIDVHKKTYAICALCENTVVAKATMAAVPEQLCTYLRLRFASAKKVHCVYEAGCSGFGLHRALEQAGFHSQVIHPNALLSCPQDSVKTDRKDAAKLAAQLAAGWLKGITIPSVQQERYRAQTRLRKQLVQTRTQIYLRIKSKLLYLGLLGPGDTWTFSERRLKLLETQTQEQGVDAYFVPWFELVRSLNEQIKKAETKMQEVDEITQQWVEFYRSAPGFGVLLSHIFAFELGHLAQRFGSERKLFRYLGLTPKERSSGERIRRGGITHQGPSHLRSLLIQAAWQAIRKDESLRCFYQRLKVRRGAQRAIVAVARKLIGRIRACFRLETPYQVQSLSTP